MVCSSAKEHVCVTPVDTDNSVVMARGKGGEGWVEVGGWGDIRTSVVVSTISKIKSRRK